MFPQFGPQQGMGQQQQGNSFPVWTQPSQHVSLLGQSPFLPTGQPYNPNTTAPSSGGSSPAMTDVIKALKGGR